jgi:hypothetical protein
MEVNVLLTIIKEVQATKNADQENSSLQKVLKKESLPKKSLKKSSHKIELGELSLPTIPEEDSESIELSSLENLSRENVTKIEPSPSAKPLTTDDLQRVIDRAGNLLATGRTKVKNYQRFATLQATSVQYVSQSFPRDFWAVLKTDLLDKTYNALQGSYTRLLAAHKGFVIYQSLILSGLAVEEDLQQRVPDFYKIAEAEYQAVLKLLQDLQVNLTTEYQKAEKNVIDDGETVLEASPLKNLSTWSIELQKLVDSKGKFAETASSSKSVVAEPKKTGLGKSVYNFLLNKYDTIESLEQTLSEKDMTAQAAAEGLLLLLSTTNQGGKGEFDTLPCRGIKDILHCVMRSN